MSSTRIQITVNVNDLGRLTAVTGMPSYWPDLFEAIHSARIAAEKQKMFVVPSDPRGLPVTRALTHRHAGSEVTMTLTLDPLPPLDDWEERIRQAYLEAPRG